MLNLPKTKEEARKYVMERGQADRKGIGTTKNAACAYEISDGFLFHQCKKKPKAGPEGLYCGIHAKKIAPHGICRGN